MITDAPHTNKGPLYAAIMGATWLVLHVYAVFVLDITAQPLVAAACVLALVWLYVGLFIVAHDAIHETLFGRGNPWNDRVGRVVHLLYAGFHFDTMKAAHIDHHKYPGSADDPDFHADNPTDFFPWFRAFFLRYFGLKQLGILIMLSIVQFALGANPLNLVLMWGVPAIVSSGQLFYFGTYLTHRHDDAFADDHNARSNNFPEWLSLLTCFHFGYHHEHHLYPHEPWWRLPLRRREARALESAK